MVYNDAEEDKQQLQGDAWPHTGPHTIRHISQALGPGERLVLTVNNRVLSISQERVVAFEIGDLDGTPVGYLDTPRNAGRRRYL